MVRNAKEVRIEPIGRPDESGVVQIQTTSFMWFYFRLIPRFMVSWAYADEHEETSEQDE